MRRRKQDRHLPPCLHFQHGAYYFVKGNKWEPIAGPGAPPVRDLATALTEYARRVEAPAGGMAGLIDRALRILRPKLAPNTFRQYQLAGKILKRKLAEFAPEQVMPRHLAKVKLDLANTPNMANRVLTVARLVFNVALEEQLINANPAVGIKRHPEQKRRKLLSAEEFAAIYAKASPRLQCLMDLWRGSGQRVMDVARLGERHLLDEGLYFEQQKTGARLIVRWTPELRAAVERARALNPVRALVLFPARRGQTRGKPVGYKTLYVAWRRTCAAAGVEDCDLRDLRALAATEAKRQGKNPTALLGHTTPAMTARYLRDKEVPAVDGPIFLDSQLDVDQK